MRSLALACVVACALPGLAAAAKHHRHHRRPAGAKGATPKLPLGHAGRWITDAGGRVLVVHGINMVYKLPPYYPSVAGFGDDDATFLKSIGFNAVRVGVIWKAVEPQPGVYDDTYLGRIQETVDMLERHGIVSLLDFHQDQYNERFEGEGFPDWSVQDDGLPAEPKLGFGNDYLGMPALSHAFDHFWANSPGPGAVGLQDRYAAAWAHVAARFRNDPSVLGYELMNEPWPGTVYPSCLSTNGCPAFDENTLTPFYERVKNVIRPVDPRTLIWYEPNVIFNDGAATHAGPIQDPRAGFAFHDYCLQEPQTGSNQGCDPFDDMVFNNAVAHVQSTGEALMETEFGASQDVSNLTAMVQRADRDMVPWLEWAYCGCHDPTTSGPGDKQAIVRDPAKPPTGANLVTTTLHALVEPYPQLVAGTPQSWSFDSSSRTFTLKYSTARASGRGAFRRGAVTAIATPSMVYGRHYATSVNGARIVSRRGAGVLRLAACASARQITVTVTPGGRNQSRCQPTRRKGRHRRHAHR
jgi:endoglycosylceramidase